MEAVETSEAISARIGRTANEVADRAVILGYSVFPIIDLPQSETSEVFPITPRLLSESRIFKPKPFLGKPEITIGDENNSITFSIIQDGSTITHSYRMHVEHNNQNLDNAWTVVTQNGNHTIVRKETSLGTYETMYNREELRELEGVIEYTSQVLDAYRVAVRNN